MSDPRKTEFLDCGCGTQEHLLRFDLDSWGDGPPDFYASIYLNQFRPWWKRIMPAVKYLLNLKPASCGFGHWDTWCLQYEDIPRLEALLTEFRRKREEWAEGIVNRSQQ